MLLLNLVCSETTQADANCEHEEPAARTSAARTPATRTPTARRPPHLDAPVHQLHGADADPARADSVVVHAHAANDPRGILL